MCTYKGVRVANFKDYTHVYMHVHNNRKHCYNDVVYCNIVTDVLWWSWLRSHPGTHRPKDGV